MSSNRILVVPGSIRRYYIVHCAVMVEVERLKCVEYEVAHILIHVRLKDSSIKIINSSTTVHHLMIISTCTCIRKCNRNGEFCPFRFS